MQSHEGGYFIRLTVLDRAGVFANVATQMAQNGISLESIVQRANGGSPSDAKTIILVTHATTEESVRKAVTGIKSGNYLSGSRRSFASNARKRSERLKRLTHSQLRESALHFLAGSPARRRL